MARHLAMLIDPPATLQPNTDSSLGLLLEAQRRGYVCHIFTKRDLFLKNGDVYAITQQGHVDVTQAPYFFSQESRTLPLASMDIVFIRIDPPFDHQYLYATQLLDFVAQQGVKVYNHPTSIRSYNEKIFASHFKAFLPPTLVSANLQLLKEFIDEHQKVVIKPIDAMGGRGIVIVQHDDLDKSSLLELVTDNQHKTVLAQRFLPQVQSGDKRILLIQGQPVPQAQLRIPAQTDFRANLAAGGSGSACPLNERDEEICRTIGPHLAKAGLLFVGIDVIGGYLTEINVTCPTGAVALERLTPLKIFEEIFNAIEM